MTTIFTRVLVTLLLFTVGTALIAPRMTELPRVSRRTVLVASSSSSTSSIFGDGNWFGNNNNPKPSKASSAKKNLVTNEVIQNIHGMKHRRLGGSDILVSALGLGTQRWVSTDFNAPNEQECFAMMDEAILKHGVNLIDTAEQYPIPSDGSRAREGDTERCIGKWMKDRKVARDKVVIATKITGGRNVTPQNIKKDCEGSLQRLGTDYIDVYQVP